MVTQERGSFPLSNWAGLARAPLDHPHRPPSTTSATSAILSSVTLGSSSCATHPLRFKPGAGARGLCQRISRAFFAHTPPRQPVEIHSDAAFPRPHWARERSPLGRHSRLAPRAQVDRFRRLRHLTKPPRSQSRCPSQTVDPWALELPPIEGGPAQTYPRWVRRGPWTPQPGGHFTSGIDSFTLTLPWALGLRLCLDWSAVP